MNINNSPDTLNQSGDPLGVVSAATCSPRYSFRMPDGRLPMVGGKLSWVGSRERADTEAKSWGAVAIVVMHQSAAGAWDIAEEIPLEI